MHPYALANERNAAAAADQRQQHKVEGMSQDLRSCSVLGDPNRGTAAAAAAAAAVAAAAALAAADD
jgi:hypothetical protein